MGDKTQPSVQAGQTSKAAGVAGEVGVPRSSVDLHYFKRCGEPRGDTYSTHEGEAKDKEMAGATRIVTPDKVRELQIVLYRKAHSLRPLCAATVGCMERHPMNESGEPNMGNPSVRFDEGRERVGHWPVCLSIHPFPPTPPEQGAEPPSPKAKRENCLTTTCVTTGCCKPNPLPISLLNQRFWDAECFRSNSANCETA